jgi:hypothetical protein
VTVTDSNDPLVTAVRGLQLSVDQLRTELVRKDVYEAERETDRAEVAGLRESVKEIKGTLTWLSRTLVASLLLPVLTSALVIYVIQQGGSR